MVTVPDTFVFTQRFTNPTVVALIGPNVDAGIVTVITRIVYVVASGGSVAVNQFLARLRDNSGGGVIIWSDLIGTSATGATEIARNELDVDGPFVLTAGASWQVDANGLAPVANQNHIITVYGYCI